jgi:hypothetical protein
VDSFSLPPLQELEVRIENVGPGDAFNVTATISRHPANVTIDDGDVVSGDIPASASAWSSGDTFTAVVNILAPGSDEGLLWNIEYDDACGNHHIIRDVPESPAATAPPLGSKLAMQHRLWYPQPTVSKLYPNYPNPFNPETWIPYQTVEDVDVTVRIFNVGGQLVRTMALGHKEAGFYISKDKAAYWDGKNASGEKVHSGIYFYTLEAGKFTAIRKMVVAE